MQQGEERAEYGEQVMKALSEWLNQRYGKGFSVTNLRYFRLFYQTYIDRVPEIRHMACDELEPAEEPVEKHHKACDVWIEQKPPKGEDCS